MHPRHLLAMAYGLALCVPAVPALVHRISPPPRIDKPEAPLDLAMTLFQAVGAAGHGVRTGLLTLACALLAGLATVAAWWLWRRAPFAAAGAPSALCLWAPLPLALVGGVIAVIASDAGL